MLEMITRRTAYTCADCARLLSHSAARSTNAPLQIRQLVTKSTSPRPRVPFLAQSTADSRQLLFQRRVSRVLSTENKKYVKEQTWIGVKLCVAALVIVNLVGFGLSTYEGELVEKRRPSPSEWSYLTRAAWRAALDTVFTSEATGRPVDHGKAGNYWLTCLRRLEDPDCDGKDLQRIFLQDVADLAAARGIDPIALDVSKKTPQWIAGYVEVLLELGRIAESTQHLVFDRTRSQYFPAASVAGPSNPRPRKLADDVVAPIEADCDRAFPDPSVFYNRIIHGTGFTTKQCIDALHAKANWLQFSAEDEAADECYTSAVTLASAAAPLAAGPGSLNALTATTELASHQARTGRVTAALPTYLSALAAVHVARNTASAPKTVVPATRVSEGWWADLSRQLFRADEYPLAADGDAPLASVPRLALTCTEAMLRMYIGEILFATSDARKDDGLAWTKEAVGLAEKALEEQMAVKRVAKDWKGLEQVTGLGRKGEVRCRDCLGAAVRNWDVMLAEMEWEAQEMKSPGGVRGWFAGDVAGKKREQVQRAVEELAETKTELLAKGIIGPDAFIAQP